MVSGEAMAKFLELRAPTPGPLETLREATISAGAGTEAITTGDSGATSEG